MIVVDTNIIAYLYLPGEKTAEAERVFIKDPEWSAPYLWRSEFMSVLSLYLRKKIITLNLANEFFLKASTQIFPNEYEVTCDEVLKLIINSHCSSYDCEFVALAQKLSISLVTSDQKILSEFPSVAISPKNFIS